MYVPTTHLTAIPRPGRFARALASRIAGEHPSDATDKTRRSPREQRVLVDWGGNSPGRSTIAAYSLRATPWPTISIPVTWEEIEEALATRTPELLIFLPDDVVERIDRFGDLFRPVLELTQPLPDRLSSR